jgi:hypothetical protein
MKIKMKFSLGLTKYHAHEDVWGGGIVPHILNFGARWR